MKLRGPQLLALAFLALILVGTLLLELPAMSRDGKRLPFIDALFTATSAVCVTGLVTVNTPEQFTPLGLVVILVLMQCGGLGIMTFSALFFVLMRRQLDTQSHRVLSETFSGGASSDLRSLIVLAVTICLACEAIGAVFFFFSLPDPDWEDRLFSAIFHSVSSFCNAGFSTYPDSLAGAFGNPVAIVTAMWLVTMGGLGFFVLADVGDRLRHRGQRRQLRLQTRIVLWVSAALIIIGALGIHLSEHDNVLAGMSWGDHILHCLFLSVSGRTAGLSTFDIADMRHFGLFLLILLMICGGSPGSTAGGIKTTTVGVVLAMLWSHLRGREEAEIFGRRIPRPVVQRSFIIIAFSFVIMAVAFVVLHSAGGYHPEMLAHHDDVLIPLGFEVASAYATVGLSAGVTPALTDFGKFVIIVLMYIGRLGPLTLAVAIVTEKRPLRYTLPSENVMVG